jgi:hypothetical protein
MSSGSSRAASSVEPTRSQNSTVSCRRSASAFAPLGPGCDAWSIARPGFAEEGFVGKTLRLGPKVTIAVLERDSRCKMITIDPDTAEPSGAILRQVSRAHDGMAGVYGAVLIEGMVHRGDEIELLS